MPLKGPIARATYRTSIVLAMRLFVQAGTLLLLARLMGPAEFGLFAGASSLAVMLGSLATFGTHLVLLGELSRDPARRQHVFTYAVPVTLLCGALLLLCYLLACSLLFPGRAFLPFLSIGIAEFILQPLLVLSAIEHLAAGRAATSQLIQIVPLGLRLCLATGLYVVKPDSPFAAFSYGYVAISAVATAIGLRMMTVPLPALRTWRLATKGEVRNAAGYAAMNITAVAPAELDKTLSTQLLTPAESGVYATAARVVGSVTLPVAAMMMAALPRLFREGQVEVAATRLQLGLLSAAAAYGLLLAAFLWVVAPLLAPLFGREFQGTGELIRWLCLAVPGMTLRIAVGSTLMAMGRPWMRVAFELIGLIVLSLSALVLVGPFDGIGMALALACAEWSMVLTGLICIGRSKDAIRKVG